VGGGQKNLEPRGEGSISFYL